MQALNWLLIVLLSLITLRRFVLIVAAFVPGKRAESGFAPAVTVAVPACDEEVTVAGLLKALDDLDYPEGRIDFVLISDGSRDMTAILFHHWAGLKPDAQVLEISENVGKAEALNRALQASRESELFAVYDADQRPHRDSLRLLASAFADEKVGAVSGYRSPANSHQSWVARYAAVESWVHQLAVQAGKERLGLNPTTMGGNCVYRSRAVSSVGGFRPGSLGEDVEMSLALIANGWRTRFIENAVAESLVAETLSDYWHQRARWTYGMYDAGRRASGPESLLVASGYADRLIFLASLGATAWGAISLAWPMLYLLAPLAGVLTALGRAGVGRSFPAYLFVLLPMFVVDIIWTVTASIKAVLRRPAPWRREQPRQ